MNRAWDGVAIPKSAKNPVLAGVRPNGVEDAPQFKLDIDREKAGALGLSIADVNQTLATGWASPS